MIFGQKQNILWQGMWDFVIWLRHLFRQPIFLFVTLWGHALILLSAGVFQYLERGVNPRSPDFFQSYYWAIATATTVGTADLAPVSPGGKVMAILLMVFGSLFLWSYTALFASSFVTSTVRRIGREVESEVERVGKEILVDQVLLQRLLHELEILNRTRRER